MKRTSCSRYAAIFNEISRAVTQVYPDVQVVGDVLLPQYPRPLIASILSILQVSRTLSSHPKKGVVNERIKQVALILGVFCGERIYMALGVVPPQWQRHYVFDHPYMAVFFLLFFFRSINNLLLSTGAFEVYLDGQIIWSKLASGDSPTGVHLSDFMRRLEGVYQGRSVAGSS